MFGLGLCYAGLLVNKLLNCLSLWLLVQLSVRDVCLGLGFWPASRLLVLPWAGLWEGLVAALSLGRTWARLAVVCGICLGLDLGWSGLTWFLGLCLS